ncbi:hypothetical protein KQX54_015403 [Cotesia glomerata]|uniref:Uncharacterized protein n=1 Tax=Cotesia glomerata TaxID=32391 RepID=A0AAV7IS73_COTGL|nr:hypothetical protein KQX54_015403 [Cotesia glomerata]
MNFRRLRLRRQAEGWWWSPEPKAPTLLIWGFRLSRAQLCCLNHSFTTGLQTYSKIHNSLNHHSIKSSRHQQSRQLPQNNYNNQQQDSQHQKTHQQTNVSYMR